MVKLVLLSIRYPESGINRLTNSGQPQLDEQLKKICQTTGTMMKSDHTYKIAKSLVAHSSVDARLIALRASLLIVMNENDQVMNYKLCPTDEVMIIIVLVSDII